MGKRVNKKKLLIALIVLGLLLSCFTLVAGAYYVGSSESDVYHYPSCFYVDRIKPDHLIYFDTVREACDAGYRPCKRCKPPPCTPTLLPTYPPEVTTKAATGIGTTYATLNGYIDSTGRLSCRGWFEYGTTTSYGRSTTKKSTSSGSFSEHIYGLSPGATYHFRAMASNSKGTDYGSGRSFRTLCYPIASFASSPENPVFNQMMTFNASSSSDPDGYIREYKWDFGDGDSATGKIVNHSYSLPGHYSVTLSVTDNDLLTDTETCSTHIKYPTVPAWGWIKKANTPEAGGYGEAVVSADDYIYIARCMYASSTPYFWRYNLTANSFDPMNTLGLPTGAFRSGTSLTWDNGSYIYALLGGRYSDTNRRLFYRYSISNDSWEQLNDTPFAQGAGDALTWSGYDDQLYAFLGSEKRGTVFARYNLSSSSWNTTLPFNWTCTDDGASLVWAGGEYLYALRGEYDETVPNGDFARYSIPNGTWEDMSPINESDGVGDGASLLWTEKYPDYIYALGGGSCLEDPGYNFYRYNITSNKWKPLESIPCPVGYYVGNRLGFANGHIYYWQGTPPTEKWICAGDAFLMFDLDVPPEITSYAPKLPVNDTECATRTFNITMFHSNSSLWDCFARGYSGFT